MAVTCKRHRRWGRSSLERPIVLQPGRTRQGPGPSGCLRQVLRTQNLDRTCRAKGQAGRKGPQLGGPPKLPWKERTMSHTTAEPITLEAFDPAGLLMDANA